MSKFDSCPHVAKTNSVAPNQLVLDYPFGPTVRLDLHPRYLELTCHEPVARIRVPHGGEAWLITGYPEIRQFLTDSRFSTVAATEPDTARVMPLPLWRGDLMMMDTSEHARVRRVVAKAFTMNRIEQLRERIQEIADTLLDRLAKQGPPTDLVEGFAVPLSVKVICELFGIPYEERERFRGYADVFISTFAHAAQEVDDARSRLESYLSELIELRLREREPRDDLVSQLAEASEVERLSRVEAARTGVGILMAGHHTTLSMIANISYLLLSQRELWGRLRADPGLLPTAIEEFLRIVPLRTDGSFPRRAKEDVELGGVLIRKGDTVIFHRAAANRDERVFENPHEIDLARKRNPHLGFGHGIHHCLGASLARTELAIAIKSLIRRFPELRLACTGDEVPWISGQIVVRPELLLVEW